jgi:hypothetical protein
VVFETKQLPQLAGGSGDAFTQAASIAGHAAALGTHAQQAAVAQAASAWLSATTAMGQSVLADVRATRINASTSICYGLLLDGCSYAADTGHDAAALQQMLLADNRVAAVYPVVRTATVASSYDMNCSAVTATTIMFYGNQPPSSSVVTVCDHARFFECLCLYFRITW